MHSGFFPPCILSSSKCDDFFISSQMISVYFCTFFSTFMFIYMLSLSVCNVHCIIHSVCVAYCVYGAWVYLFAAGFGVFGVLDICLLLMFLFFTQWWGHFMDNLSLEKNKHFPLQKKKSRFFPFLFFKIGFWYLNDLLVSFFLSLFWFKWVVVVSLPPLAAMAAQQATAGTRNEKAGEAGFFQNQTTVCSCRVCAVPCHAVIVHSVHSPTMHCNPIL